MHTAEYSCTQAPTIHTETNATLRIRTRGRPRSRNITNFYSTPACLYSFSMHCFCIEGFPFTLTFFYVPSRHSSSCRLMKSPKPMAIALYRGGCCLTKSPETVSIVSYRGCYCRFCGAQFWYAERLKGKSFNERQVYHLCCGDGRLRVQRPREPPVYIKQLFEDRHFMDNIRTYNQMFAMTSFGAKIDDSINVGRGPYVFKVTGQIYHWIGSLCPPPGEVPRFLQLYIYDTDNEVSNRMKHFGGIDNSGLDPQIVEGLMHFLDSHNELVQLFRTTRDKCRQMDIPEFKIRLYNA